MDCLFCKTTTTNPKFCSRSCSASYNNTGRIRTQDTKNKISIRIKEYVQNNPHPNAAKVVKRICEYCDKDFFVMSTSKRKTCSRECGYCLCNSIRGRYSAQKRIKRSKQEIELFELCSNTFNNVSSNTPVAKKWDSDIVLNDHKICIFWNGPWHYREMNCFKHSLKQVKSRDNIKIKLFTSLGWDVLVFEDRTYTPKEAFDIIKNLVENGGTAPPSVRYERTASL